MAHCRNNVTRNLQNFVLKKLSAGDTSVARHPPWTKRHIHYVYPATREVSMPLLINCLTPPPLHRSQDALLLRGAVFFVSMSLWGVRKVKHLDLTFASVLPSIKQVLNHPTTGICTLHFVLCTPHRRCFLVTL